MHTYALGLPDTDYIIPSGVTSIEDSAFSHSNLKSVSIPYTITSIGEFSFHKCKNLKTINYNGIISMFKKISLNSNSFDKAKQVRCNDGTTDI